MPAVTATLAGTSETYSLTGAASRTDEYHVYSVVALSFVDVYGALPAVGDSMYAGNGSKMYVK